MQNQLAHLIKNQMFEGFLLVKTSEQRTSSNGSKFLDLTLSDVSGEFNGKMWDGTIQPPKPGTVVKVRAMMNEFNGRPQLRVAKLRAVSEKDEVDMSLLVPCAPEAADTMEGRIRERVAKIEDNELRMLVEYRLDEAGDALSYYPAAQKLHHAERSGLLHHTDTMLRMGDLVCDIYPILDRDLLAAGVILHDLCKITEIVADESGVASDYSREGLLLGHLVQGVSVLMRACEKLNVREELKLMLSHMILSHHDLPEYGSPRRPMFPEAEVLHILDLLDARMFEMNFALNAVAPGTFTDRIWSLERKLYRREKTQKDASEPEAAE